MKHLLPVFCVLALSVPLPAAAQTLTIEAEYYIASHDIDYVPISAAGTLLQGLDCADEWTEYQVGVSSFGLYSVQMLCRGDLNVNYLLRLIMTPMGSGDVQSIDIPFKGAGWGWTCWVTATGSGLIGLYEPAYTARLLFVSDSGATQIDNIGLTSQVPTGTVSWGMIKSMYE